MKVLVIGNSGSGKSTYAAGLAAAHGLAHLDLDTIVWEPGKSAVRRSPEAIAGDLERFLAAEPRWVVEGCYGDVAESIAPRCTLLVFLDPGLGACLRHNEQRPWEPHKYASLAEQNTMLAQLQAWVAAYYTRDDACSYAWHRRLFDAHAGEKAEISPEPGGLGAEPPS